MKWSRMSVMSVPQLNWRQPWCWPRPFQHVLFTVAGALGVMLLSPWWLHSWQTLDEAIEAQAKLQDKQAATQALREQTARLMQTHKQPEVSLADTAVLTQLAQQQGLQLSQLGMDKPQQSAALNALQLQQLPVHLKVQGAWDGWLNWLALWPTAAPGVTVASLEIKAEPRGGISAQVLALAPQSTATESAFELSGVNSDRAAGADPFNAEAWVTAQRTHAQQQPTYSRWVAPELLRPREVLEAFPRERLQYVGHMASGAELEALIKVLPSTGVKKDTQMMSVYRVRLGQRLGHDFGKVLAIQPDHLLLQELAVTSTGEWQTREVRLTLLEAAP
jgi:type IV pilus assembly protein PilP